MKRSLLIATSLLLASNTLSMTQMPRSEILTENDYRLQWQEFSMHRPALSAPLDGSTPYWESFNQWLCFPADNVDVTCLEEDLHERSIWTPALTVVQDDHYYEIAMESEPEPDCALVKSRWHELIDGEEEVCVYAAAEPGTYPIPQDSGVKDGSSWVIDRLKSGKGYWNAAADENWRKDPDDVPDEADENTPSETNASESGE
jgi:hypothetical protein